MTLRATVHRIAVTALLLCVGSISAQAPGPEQLFQEAVAAQQRGDDALAVRKYGELLRQHPEAVGRVETLAAGNAGIYLLAAQTRFNVGQYDLARHDADTAQKLNPKLAGLLTINGMILEQTADYDDAEKALLQAIAADPDDYNAQFYLGALFYFKRDMPKARVHLMRALQLQPTSVQARYELALVARADGHLNTALQELQTVVRESPDWLQPHVELSALYYKLGRPADGAKERELVDRMMAALQQSQAQAARLSSRP